jgi:hypothetical protein
MKTIIAAAILLASTSAFGAEPLTPAQVQILDNNCPGVTATNPTKIKNCGTANQEIRLLAAEGDIVGLDARVGGLETTSGNHEARITDLENAGGGVPSPLCFDNYVPGGYLVDTNGNLTGPIVTSFQGISGEPTKRVVLFNGNGHGGAFVWDINTHEVTINNASFPNWEDSYPNLAKPAGSCLTVQ